MFYYWKNAEGQKHHREKCRQVPSYDCKRSIEGRHESQGLLPMLLPPAVRPELTDPIDWPALVKKIASPPEGLAKPLQRMMRCGGPQEIGMCHFHVFHELMQRPNDIGCAHPGRSDPHFWHVLFGLGHGCLHSGARMNTGRRSVALKRLYAH